MCSMLILEDDVELTSDFDRWMPSILRALPTDFGLLYFGASGIPL